MTTKGALGEPRRGTRFARRLRRVLGVLAGLLIGAELLYLVGANLFLSLGGLAKLFESTNTIDAKFRRAWTIWPGRVHIRGLRIVFQDKNLQWSLDIERVQATIHLTELTSRTFHAHNVSGDGAVFRFRHRVEPWSQNEPSVRVLPPIPEFPGTAVFEATVPEAPLTDEKYNLWTVHLENVDVGVSEVWSQQFRYVGSGRARGAFRLRAARTLWVGPASLELEPGRLTAGHYQLSPGLAGRIDCVVHPFDVRKPEGREVFRFISVRVKLRAPSLSLAASELFFPRENSSVIAEGGELIVDARMDHGTIQASSELELRQRKLVIEHPRGKLELGRGALIARARPGGHGEARLELGDGRLTLPDSSAEPVRIEDVKASVVSSSLDAVADWALLEANLQQLRIFAPDVRWFNRFIARTDWSSSSGSAGLSASARYEDGVLEGKALASLLDVHAVSPEARLVVDGQATLAFSKARVAELSGVVTGDLIGRRVTLQRGASVFEAGGMRVEVQAQAGDGTARAQLTAKFESLSARASGLSLRARTKLVGDIERWDLRRGTASTRVTAELDDVVLRSVDSGLTARAKHAAVSLRSERPEPSRNLRRAGLPLTLAAALRHVTFENGAGETRFTGRADELLLDARVAARANGDLDAALRSSARGLEAAYGRQSFQGSPELDVAISGLNQAAQRGRLRADLVVREFSAYDTSDDGDCPWSTIGLGRLRADAELRGDENADVHLAGELSKVHLAWGDFSTSAANADFDLSFDEALLAERSGKLLVSAGLRGAKLKSGSAAPLGWEASVPALDFKAELDRSNETFSGPLRFGAKRASARIGRTPFNADLSADVWLALNPEQRRALGRGTAAISGLGLKLKDDEVRDWWANVVLDFVHVSAKENLDVRSSFRAKVRDGLPALTVLASQGDLPGWVPDVFPLRELEAKGTVERHCRLTEVRLSGLNGGPFASVGRVQSVTDAVRGAFLVRMNGVSALSAGVRFDDQESGVSLFAGKAWLEKEFAELDSQASQDDSCSPLPTLCGN